MSYRLLVNGDVIKPDDDVLCDDCYTWLKMRDEGPLFVGMEYIIGFFKPMRRKEQKDEN